MGPSLTSQRLGQLGKEPEYEKVTTSAGSKLLVGMLNWGLPSASAQNAVVDPSLSWLGYMNVYNLVGGNSQGS